MVIDSQSGGERFTFTIFTDKHVSNTIIGGVYEKTISSYGDVFHSSGWL